MCDLSKQKAHSDGAVLFPVSSVTMPPLFDTHGVLLPPLVKREKFWYQERCLVRENPFPALRHLTCGKVVGDDAAAADNAAAAAADILL